MRAGTWDKDISVNQESLGDMNSLLTHIAIIIEAVLRSNVYACLTPGILHKLYGLCCNLCSTQLLKLLQWLDFFSRQ